MTLLDVAGFVVARLAGAPLAPLLTGLLFPRRCQDAGPGCARVPLERP